jgi:hypothetical protein
MAEGGRRGGRPEAFDAFHLPAVDHPSVTSWTYGRGDDAFEVRVPRITPAQLRRQVEALAAARDEHLARLPVARVVEVVDAVAARLLDPSDPLRQAAERALPAVTGYSSAMIRLVLNRMAADWRAAPLRELLRAEFGDPRVLDGFVAAPRTGGLRAAYGPRLAAHVFSGNVPGVAVTALVRSLLVKAATLGKTAVGEPLLAALFARGVAETDPGLGACIAVTYWAGGDEEMERAALEAADAVVVYGGADAVASVRARSPASARFLGYGPKVSFGVVAREALASPEAARDAAAGAALDASTFDQQGCVSPHLFYVQEGGAVSPRAWAALLAQEMERVERIVPRGTLAPGESSAIRQLRGEAEFTEAGGGGLALHASAEGTAWTVIYDPAREFVASCLNRVVRVKPVEEMRDLAALAAPYASVLQTVGVAGPGAIRAVGDVLGPLGASRITPLGRMAWPPPQWHHDGRPPLGDLVRWCDVEPG